MTKQQTLHNIQWQAAREAYAYQCWPIMTKSKSVIVKAADTRPTNVGQQLLVNICWPTTVIVGQHLCHTGQHFVRQQYGGDGGLSRRRRRAAAVIFLNCL